MSDSGGVNGIRQTDSDWTSAWSNETREPARSKHEYRLLQDLMTNYEPAALPSLNISDAVLVKMGIALFQIRELVRVCVQCFYHHLT